MASAAVATTTPETVDDLCAFILGSTSLDDVEQQVIPMMRKLAKSTNSKNSKKAHLFEGKLSDGGDPLATLNPRAASAGYLFLLIARCSSPTVDIAEMMNFINHFINHFDSKQTRYLSDLMLQVVHFIIHFATQQNTLPMALRPVQSLLIRYAPQGYLTAIHVKFLALVLTCRAYNFAYELLNRPIEYVNVETFPITYKDHLLYHYYGGVIMAALRCYPQAMDMLEICVSAPGPAASLIQIDAYKKLILLQLQADGKTSPLPKYTSSAVVSACKTSCAAYIEYAQAYESRHKENVAALANRHCEIFAKDLNLGLFQLVARSFQCRIIQHLTNTYITLSLPEIARAVDKPSDTEAGLVETFELLNFMLQSRQIYGSISEVVDGAWDQVTITFTDDPEPYTTHATVHHVSRAIQATGFAEKKFVAANRALEASGEFVTKALNSAGTVQASGNDTEDLQIDITADWDAPDYDR